MPTLVAYISGHGFGHASRTIELLNAIADRAPEVRIRVRTSVAPWLFQATARAGIVVTPVECDTGAVQIDSLRLDEMETIRRAERFMATFSDRISVEAKALAREDASLVIADAPPLGIAAGKAAGRPTVLLGNFTWDWIYAAYPGGAAVAEAIGRIYASADLAVLVSFGGYGVDQLDLDALARTSGHGIVMTGATRIDGAPLQTRGAFGAVLPLDETGMYARGFRYEDVVKAVDVVVSKPGYGIIAECAANGTALLYTSRGHFAEYDVLVAGMPRYLRTRYLDQATLLAGRWAPALDDLLAQPDPPERADVSGAEVAAELLLGMM